MTDRPIIFSAPMVRALLAGTKTQTRRLIRDEVRDPPGLDSIHPKHTAKHPAPYLDAYCGAPRTATNPRGMSDRWCWWTRDDRQCLPTFKVGFVPGDRLWVREAWATWMHAPDMGGRLSTDPGQLAYKATDPEWDALMADRTSLRELAAKRENGRTGNWVVRSPIHMPRAFSRLTLTVTAVRVERLNDISEADAQAEGCRDSGAGFTPDPSDIIGAPPVPTAQWAFQCLWCRLHGPQSWEANPFVVALTFSVIPANIDSFPAAGGRA